MVKTTCDKCGGVRTTQGGRTGCKPCRAAYMRDYNAIHLEARHAAQHAEYQKNKSRYARNAERWLLANPIKAAKMHHKAHLQYKYGMTPEQFDALVVAQSGRCSVCADHPKQLAVDHDHVSGRIRELLCHPCNRAIGHMRDDPVRLENAAAYLRAAMFRLVG